MGEEHVAGVDAVDLALFQDQLAARAGIPAPARLASPRPRARRPALTARTAGALTTLCRITALAVRFGRDLDAAGFALVHGGIANRVKVNIRWLDAEMFEHPDANLTAELEPLHGILVPGGFGERGSEGKIASVQFAREEKIPFFGICLGMQMACIEAARNLAGISDASTTEFGETAEPVVGMITEWMSEEGLQQRAKDGDLGGTMRLGAYPAKLAANSHVATLYGATDISERHRHRYEVNVHYRDALEKGGLIFSGMSPDGQLPEIVERPDHPWFIGVQFHPELKSRPFDPHPLFAGFIGAALKQSRLV